MKMNNYLAVATLTYKECLRYRVIYGVAAFVGLGMFGSLVLSGLFMRDVQKVLLEISMSFSSVGILVIPMFLVISQISSDIDSRTIYSILSRNVTRGQYVWGKFLGIIGVTAVVVVVLELMMLGTIYAGKNIYQDYFFEHLQLSTVLIAGLYTGVSCLVLSACSFLWSVITTSPLLATLLTLSTYMIGHSTSDIVRFMSMESSVIDVSPGTKMLVKAAMYVFPNLENFDFKYAASYGDVLESTMLVESLFYGISYIVVMLTLSSWILSKRDL